MNRILAILILFALPVYGQNANDFLFQKKKATAGFENVFLPSGTNLFPYFSSAGTITTLASGATGRSLLGAENAEAAKSTLNLSGLGAGTNSDQVALVLSHNVGDFSGGAYMLQQITGATRRGIMGFGIVDEDNEYVTDYVLRTPDLVPLLQTGDVAVPITITLPTTSGTLLLTNGSGASLTNLDASNISSGSLALARIAQGGATSGQALTWNGTAWAPAGTITTTTTTIIFDLAAIPAADPSVAGQLWRDGTTLKISTGP